MRVPDVATRSTPLTDCDREPIHVPGHIQPQGVLVATHPNSLRVSHVSANFEASVGLPVAEALDAELGALLGPELLSEVNALLESGTYTPSNVLTMTLPIPTNPVRSVTAHRYKGRTIIELELPPTSTDHERFLALAHGIMVSLRNAQTVEQLCALATREVRRLTGYDRVIIYQFDPDGHGSVVAEDRESTLEPLLHLKYPASDIPQQARQLYVKQRVRSIPDMEYVAEGLLAAPGAADALELDMTYCSLRGVSPVHREYMRNMNVRATLAISLLPDSELWGMMVCHHRSPLVQPAEIRAFCDVVGQLLSVLLQKVAEAEELATRMRRLRCIADLRSELENSDNLAGTLRKQSAALLDLVHAGGALIRLGEETVMLGDAPAAEIAGPIVEILRQDHREEIVGLADAGQPGGVAEACADRASGILLMPILNNPGDAIAWFRPEVVSTVQWAGDPRLSKSPDPASRRLSPRTSFAVWSELVRGRSKPWSPTDLHTAGELRRTITGALLRHAEMKLAQLAAYDPLTNLANRRTLKARVDQCRKDAIHPTSAMLFFDLDRFKIINDSMGHAVGDQVLTEIAMRLRQVAPAGATTARLGGDEFVIFWPGAGQSEALVLADSITRKLSEPLMLNGEAHYVTVSVGIACSDAAGLDDLLREADESMYAAKRQGGGRVMQFQPSLHATVLTANQIQQDLFRALEKAELEIHYQPIVSVPGRVIVGFEALLRWRHAVRGWISPAAFIPCAEETGMITRIGAWVFAGAVRQLAVWHRTDSSLTMSINISARQLMEGSFSTFVGETLAKEQVGARSISLEVTESALMHETAVRELHRLRGLGVRVAVDDFGTGYSSLAYLQSLPVNVVKIDRSFVAPLGSETKASRFFAAILALAHTLDIGTVAEGCETEEQWRIIEDAGCNYVQGWLISRALDAGQATLLVHPGLVPPESRLMRSPA
jgi:diguanylate cyclase (GGDEF)-like protein